MEHMNPDPQAARRVLLAVRIVHLVARTGQHGLILIVGVARPHATVSVPREEFQARAQQFEDVWLRPALDAAGRRLAPFYM